MRHDARTEFDEVEIGYPLAHVWIFGNAAAVDHIPDLRWQTEKVGICVGLLSPVSLNFYVGIHILSLLTWTRLWLNVIFFVALMYVQCRMHGEQCGEPAWVQHLFR